MHTLKNQNILIHLNPNVISSFYSCKTLKDIISVVPYNVTKNIQKRVESLVDHFLKTN